MHAITQYWISFPPPPPPPRARKYLLQLDEALSRLHSASYLRFPDWWRAGAHDRALVFGVSKYGLAQPDRIIAEYPELFDSIIEKVCVCMHVRVCLSQSGRPRAVDTQIRNYCVCVCVRVCVCSRVFVSVRVFTCCRHNLRYFCAVVIA